MANTKSLVVQCGDAREKGSEQAFIVAAGQAECTVTVVDASRKRRVATVEAPEARTYRCFEADADVCR